MKNLPKIICLLVCYLPVLLFAAPLSSEDVKWLNRVTYGIDTETTNAYLAEGREAYLTKQLQNNADDRLPVGVAALIAALRVSVEPAKDLALEKRQERKRIKQVPKDQKKQAKMKANQAANQYVEEAMRRHLLRAMYSPAQLKEQMVWFWFNHFNVSKEKGPLVKIMIADYEEHAIRPHALGKFRNLLMATLRHPAMLLYLDNSKNAVGKINENYARELMELHTLGVDGGYSQQDVQELSRILTGVGVNWSNRRPKFTKQFKQQESNYQRDGAFEFNPMRHDFGDKLFLGKKITGTGFAEIEQVVDMLARHPSTARFVSNKLATYFVADAPPPDLVARMAKTFLATDGDISATLRVLFESKEFIASLGGKAKDPLHFVVSAMRFTYDGQQLSNMQPVIGWLRELGQPLYGHHTPDGYGMVAKDWLSPEQLTMRFEVAQRIGGGKAKLIDTDINPKTQAAPVLTNKLYSQAIEPSLSAQSKSALAKAASQSEWNAFLLSSPEFIYR